MRIKDLPEELRTICVEELGHDPEDETTPRKALGMWSQWEIGDSHWGNKLLDLLNEIEGTSY